MPFSTQHLEIINTVRQHLPPGMKAWLVGGAIRDMLLGLNPRDMDFVLPENTRLVAGQVAKSLGAITYVLDDRRNTMRVIHKPAYGDLLYLDFSVINGSSLESDLARRDFSINALAFDLSSLDVLIDPLGGLQDLHDKRLKSCSSSAMCDDPVRCLRGVRLAGLLGFQIDPVTIHEIHQSISNLYCSAHERVRDELFHILGDPHPERALRALDALGGMNQLFPIPNLNNGQIITTSETSSWQYGLSVVNYLVNIIEILYHQPDREGKGNWLMGMVSLHLGRYRPNFREYLGQQITSYRSKQALIVLAALFMENGRSKDSGNKPPSGKSQSDFPANTWASKYDQWLANLVLSKDEITWLNQLINGLEDVTKMMETGISIETKTIYHFFQAAGEAGVGSCLVKLADRFACCGQAVSRENLEKDLSVLRQLLDAWWKHPEQAVRPPKLIKGSDLINILKIKPGPQIGELLEGIRLAQVEGRVTSRTDALEFARNMLKTRSENPRKII